LDIRVVGAASWLPNKPPETKRQLAPLKFEGSGLST
jgi:hypothetical protein